MGNGDPKIMIVFDQFGAFDIARSRRRIHHNREPENLRRRFEVAKRVGTAHPTRLEFTNVQRKQAFSDSTLKRVDACTKPGLCCGAAIAWGPI